MQRDELGTVLRGETWDYKVRGNNERRKGIMEELKINDQGRKASITQTNQKHTVTKPTYVELCYSWLPARSICSNKRLHLAAEVVVEFERSHCAVNSDVLPGGPNLHLHITNGCQERKGGVAIITVV